MKTTIRQITSLDEVPPYPPKRYTSGPYVRLRWKVGPYSYVECYEHRLLAGFPPEIVHHQNENKQDNTAGNLQDLTRAEHMREHHQLADDALITRLYLSGLSTYEVAGAVGLDPSTVWRSLRRSQTPTRSRREAARHDYTSVGAR